MAVRNTQVAEMFERLATLLDIEGANPFRIRAYRNAARTIRDLPQSVDSMLAEGQDLSELPGIGEDLAGKIAEIVKTGHLGALEEHEASLPAGLTELAAIEGLGPKRIKQLHDELGVAGVDDLERALRTGKVGELKGFGPTLQKRIEAGLRRRDASGGRTRLFDTRETAEALTKALQGAKGVHDVVVAGSYRRRKETVGDLDILVTCTEGCPVMERFLALDDVGEILAKGDTRSTVRLKSGLQVDVRVVPRASFGSALCYFTGSKDHSIAIRTLGVKKGLKINEYGVFRGDRRIAGATEEEVFASVGLPFIEPELRENSGEIEAARKGKLPRLITLDDIRGDLHTHTKATDGKNTLREMAEAAMERGYEYLAITDHSQSTRIAGGLSAKELLAEVEKIRKLDAELSGIHLLAGCEVDILEDGLLDFEDDVLAELDLAVCSVHSKFNLAPAKQTDRILRALDRPACRILGHPTGRLILKREPYPFDVEAVMRAASERGVWLELNAQPDRLDLSAPQCRMAKELGARISIGTDAHSTTTLAFMEGGVEQARRGWLESKDVVNTWSWSKLSKALR